jgi:hypothetical protein
MGRTSAFPHEHDIGRPAYSAAGHDWGLTSLDGLGRPSSTTWPTAQWVPLRDMVHLSCRVAGSYQRGRKIAIECDLVGIYHIAPPHPEGDTCTDLHPRSFPLRQPDLLPFCDGGSTNASANHCNSPSSSIALRSETARYFLQDAAGVLAVGRRFGYSAASAELDPMRPMIFAMWQ